MPHKTLHPPAAKELLDGTEAWIYLDVRTVEEFHQGHAPGAYNVPVAIRGPGGMSLNPDFGDVVQKRFPKHAKLILGCAAGIRSERACEILSELGYENLINMNGGFTGRRDQTGRLLVEGWLGCGFDTETSCAADHTYAGLCAT
jgi:rhodanese-related sulfurtransferase